MAWEPIKVYLTASTVSLQTDNLHCSSRLTWQREGFGNVFFFCFFFNLDAFSLLK